MIGHALLALFLTWTVLVGLLHLTLFLTFWLHRRVRKSPEDTALFRALVSSGVLILGPLFIPIYAVRAWQRRRIARRLRQALHRTEIIDLTVLPEDEQCAFYQRLRSDDEDTAQVVREAYARVRAVQEDVK